MTGRVYESQLYFNPSLFFYEAKCTGSFSKYSNDTSFALLFNECISVRPTAQSSLALQCVNLLFPMRTSVIATFIHAPHACVQQLLSTHHQAELSPHAAHKPAEVAVCVELVDELRQHLQRRFAPAHLKGTAEGGKRGEMHS